jgi:sphingomyelin phosphodiesterase 2
MIGTGCCIFSKHLIQEVMQFTYSLNSYPHMINHGDWFGGKSAGLAIINYHQMIVNVYITHLVANYSDEYPSRLRKDNYHAHRIAQLFELGQFIANTSQVCDITFMIGDLNTIEKELGFKILRQQAGLLDSFHERPVNFFLSFFFF